MCAEEVAKKSRELSCVIEVLGKVPEADTRSAYFDFRAMEVDAEYITVLLALRRPLRFPLLLHYLSFFPRLLAHRLHPYRHCG